MSAQTVYGPTERKCLGCEDGMQTLTLGELHQSSGSVPARVWSCGDRERWGCGRRDFEAVNQWWMQRSEPAC